MLQDKILTREEPKQDQTEYPWDQGAIRRFNLDSADVRRLEAGEVVWVGDTAYSLEDKASEDSVEG